MPKTFYTEHDIEDMAKRGIMSLDINDNIVLTDLAYEKAQRLGLKLVRDKADNPPAAPVRPYIAQASASRPSEAPPTPTADLPARIRSAVIARLGNQVDSALLDTIIQRVLTSTGVK